MRDGKNWRERGGVEGEGAVRSTEEKRWMDGFAFCVRAAVRFTRHDLMERKRGGAVFLECV